VTRSAANQKAGTVMVRSSRMPNVPNRQPLGRVSNPQRMDVHDVSRTKIVHSQPAHNTARTASNGVRRVGHSTFAPRPKPYTTTKHVTQKQGLASDDCIKSIHICIFLEQSPRRSCLEEKGCVQSSQKQPNNIATAFPSKDTTQQIAQPKRIPPMKRLKPTCRDCKQDLCWVHVLDSTGGYKNQGFSYQEVGEAQQSLLSDFFSSADGKIQAAVCPSCRRVEWYAVPDGEWHEIIRQEKESFRERQLVDITPSASFLERNRAGQSESDDTLWCMECGALVPDGEDTCEACGWTFNTTN